jgi:putative N6-adenine-specific DNA methylase
LRRKAAEQIRVLGHPNIFASDIDPEACRELGESIRRCSLADAVSVACRDFFELDPRDLTDRPGLLALNPPYGRRMGNVRASRELLCAVIARIRSRYGGWKFTLVIPAGRDLPEIELPFQAHACIHGGLPVNLIVGKVPAS